MNNKKDRVLESWPPPSPPRRSLSILSPRGRDNVFSFFPRNMLPSVFSPHQTKRDSPPGNRRDIDAISIPHLSSRTYLCPYLHQFLSSNWKSEQGSPSNYRLVNSFSRDSRDRVGSLNRFTRDQSCREPIIHIYIYPRFVTILESPKRAEATRTIELITSFRLNEPRLTVHAKETSPLPSSLAHFPLPRFFNFFPGNFGRKPDSRD